METPTPPSSTLYPKISGKHADFIANIEYHRENFPAFPKDATEIPLVGTVKLHGAHNDIVIHADDTIQFQSRNVVNLGLENDSYNFVKTMNPQRADILTLKKRIHSRFRERNPGVAIEDEQPLVIAGEWIGPGVQKVVAISEVPTRLLIIISICINGKWQPDEDYADIYCPEIGVYHVSRGGWYRSSIPLGDVEKMKAALEALQPLGDEVERECPFAKTFGLIGQGEGIVFKPTLGTVGEDAQFWLKVKGPLAMTGGLRVRKLKKEVGMEQVELAKAFAETVVTEPRLEQAWDFLRETGVEQSGKGIGSFLKWLHGDVEIEEKREIEELGVDKALLNKQVVYIGRTWYLKRVMGDGSF